MAIPTKNEAYWLDRTIEIGRKNFKSTLKFEKELDAQLRKQFGNLSNELNSFYVKYAKDKKITVKEAQNLLKPIELKEYREKVEDYRNFLHILGEDEVLPLMKEVRARNKVTRIQYMKEVIEMEVNKLSINQYRQVEDFLCKQYQETFDDYQGVIAKGFGISKAFHAPSIQNLKAIIQYPYSGDMFSNRIWKANEKIKTGLIEVLTNGMSVGKDIDTMSAELKRFMMDSTGNNYKSYDIRRIVRTESAFIQEKAKHDVNKEYGITSYIFLANSACCKKCQDLDNEIFDETQRQMGKTCPPMHPHCRCSTAPKMTREGIERARKEFLDKKKAEKAKKEQKAKQQKIPKKEYNYTGDYLKQLHPSLKRADDVAKQTNFMLPYDYIEKAGNKIENAPDFARELYELFEDEIDFVTFNEPNGKSFFSPRTGLVTLDIMDYTKSRIHTYQNTFFHEIGHLLDAQFNDVVGEGFSSHGKLTNKFRRKLEEETYALIDRYLETDMAKREIEKYVKMGYPEYQARSNAFNTLWHRQFKPHVQISVSDIIGGVTRLEYRGRGGHSEVYWQDRNKVPKEAFAEFFAATMNGKDSAEELRLLKNAFPESYEIFKEICEKVVEEYGD